MALVGVYGRVLFDREWPEGVVVDSSRIVTGASNALDVGEAGLWSGDRVAILCPQGVPLQRTSDNYATCPDGFSFYGESGGYEVGPALLQRLRSGTFYGADPSKAFYEQLPTVPLRSSLYAYVHRDELDNVQFYQEEMDALNGSGNSLIRLANLDFGTLLISPAPNGSFSDTLTTVINSELAAGERSVTNGEIGASLVLSSSTFSTLTTELSSMDAAEVGWQQVASLQSWVFETNVDMLDQSAIGQMFGESAKGMLKGAGSFEGLVCGREDTGTFNANAMMKLMLLTQTGAKALARFVIATERPEIGEDLPPETMFYEAPILLSSTTVNVAAGDIVTISAQFIASGRIRIVGSC